METKFSIKRLVCLFPIIGLFIGFCKCVLEPLLNGEYVTSIVGLMLCLMAYPFVRVTMLTAMGEDYKNK